MSGVRTPKQKNPRNLYIVDSRYSNSQVDVRDIESSRYRVVLCLSFFPKGPRHLFEIPKSSRSWVLEIARVNCITFYWLGPKTIYSELFWLLTRKKIKETKIFVRHNDFEKNI